ncbi:membrane protein insertase YidC [Aquibacillus koreensis]|uniref:Membrane protein insertase YidC n=1 Tax=Aquibacillus koreensis TaxID=279446 RepID=A0A9X3WNI7_9BACI|nr:membrane protein insertase YidC [Aquibacillus koreensis]MCT2536191.1 membrane protein insertase YidC [Aquibacillus koreensis]MDC3422115.1 membrane protein insertase YidC [Aquibacillus koreensis]
MSKNTVFTYKKASFVGSIILVLFLSGCQAANGEPIDPDTAGFFDRYFVLTFSSVIKGVANFFHGNYGLSIVLVTILIRLALMPLMLKQTKGSYQTREKMAIMKPELDDLKEKYKEKKDSESQRKMQQEMMELYKKHNFNPMTSIGCLPMLIQFPILIGFYYAIRSTPEIASHSFLWFNLGQSDLIMPFIAAAIYFFQFKATQIGLDAQQRKQMAIMGLISPLMIGFISFNAPAALPLYWAVGGTFLIFQQVLSKKLYQQKPSTITTEPIKN